LRPLIQRQCLQRFRGGFAMRLIFFRRIDIGQAYLQESA
jgi:hypothetical protein